LFQLWRPSPFSCSLGVGVFNDKAARSLHLGFAIFLAFLDFPRLKSSHLGRVPLLDWLRLLRLLLLRFSGSAGQRPGIPTRQAVIVACAGMLPLLGATRRERGLPMTCVVAIFLLYVFAGHYAPDIIAYRGASLP
jgi:TRAP-type uncharacterized transport system fused permease subunit